MNIGIIGAGVTGLTAGFELCKKGHNVTIIESSDQYGGLASSIELGQTYLEKFYHHIFTSDIELLNLIDELGITKKLLWIEPKNAIYINKKLYPFSTPKDLLNFKELPFINRVLMGVLVLFAKYVKDWKSLESMSAKDWIIKYAGKSVYEKVWGPLLYSKFDIDAENISAVWIWNKFKLRGSTRSKGLNKELLGYMDGGFELIYDNIAKKIAFMGGKIILNETLTALNQNQDNTINVITSETQYNFDKVLLTFAPSVLNDIKTPFSKNYMQKVNKLKYKANICIILELKKPQTPYYWITVSDKELPFVLFVEHTNFMFKDKYGVNIVYLSRYIDESDSLYKSDNQEIITSFIDGIKNIAPDFKEEDIINAHVFKAKYAQPIVSKNYSKILLPYKTPLKNVFMANMANIYPEDRGQNYCVRLGNEIAKTIMEDKE